MTRSHKQAFAVLLTLLLDPGDGNLGVLNS